MARQSTCLEKLGRTIRAPTKTKRIDTIRLLRQVMANDKADRPRRSSYSIPPSGKMNAFSSIAVKGLEPAENEIVFGFIARTLEDKKKVCQHPHEDQTRRCWRKITGLRL